MFDQQYGERTVSFRSFRGTTKYTTFREREDRHTQQTEHGQATQASPWPQMMFRNRRFRAALFTGLARAGKQAQVRHGASVGAAGGGRCKGAGRHHFCL